MEQATVAAAALTWAQRAQAELGAEARFKSLSQQLIAAKASAKVIEMSRSAEVDESRHAVMCSQVARDLGHDTGFASFAESTLSFEKPWENERDYRDQLLCEVVLMCCITETINASLLNNIYASSKATPAKKTIQEILKDEVKHSQMGWAHLSLESKKRDISFLGKYLGFMLEISVKDELFAPSPVVEDSQCFEYGVMPVALRLDQFKETFKNIVRPGFQEFNIPTLAAEDWLASKDAI